MRLSMEKIKGFLLDITGVLYESGSDGGKAIEGSVAAVQRLRDNGYAVRFVSNESQTTREGIMNKLKKHGFQMIKEEIFTPCPAVLKIVRERDLRPFLIVHPDVLPDFEGIGTSNPNCVILGDAVGDFTYENLNKAFRILVGQEKPLLYSLGKGKFYRENDHLTLDVGPFTAALEYACGAEATVVGKPNPEFFLTAVRDLNLQPNEVVMVGDDIESDVGGAQACGIKGILVRTGKYRPENEQHLIKPFAVVNNLAAAVDFVCRL